MATGGSSIRIQCPSCGNVVSVSGVRGVALLNCPHCSSKIKITVPDHVSRPAPVALDQDEIYRYEGDITLMSQIPLIGNIVIKDVLAFKRLFIVLFIVSLVLTGLIAAQASSRGSDDPDMTAEQIRNKKIDGISNAYLVSLAVLAPLLILTTNHVYGMEVKRGTMRLLTLYPLNMNGLSIAKITSTAVIFGIFQILLLVIPTYPLKAEGIYPWITSIMVMCFLMNLLIIISAAFATHIITFITGKLVLTMNRLVVIMVVLYGMLTEQFFRVMAMFIMILSNPSVDEGDRIIQRYSEVGRAAGLFSPYHAGGRMLTSLQGVATGNSDVGLVLFIALALIISGYILGKKVYLDVFIRE